QLAELLLELLGFSVLRDGNILQFAHMKLSVVEACSGLRSLITLSFFCMVYSYFFEKTAWMRVLVTLLAIPAAILVNAFRIVCTGVLGKYNMAWTTGVYHESIGWAAVFVGFALVFLTHRMMQRIAHPAAKAAQ